MIITKTDSGYTLEGGGATCHIFKSGFGGAEAFACMAIEQLEAEAKNFEIEFGDCHDSYIEMKALLAESQAREVKLRDVVKKMGHCDCGLVDSDNVKHLIGCNYRVSKQALAIPDDATKLLREVRSMLGDIRNYKHKDIWVGDWATEAIDKINDHLGDSDEDKG